MRMYECVCSECSYHKTIRFDGEPFPELDSQISHYCDRCEKDCAFSLVPTRKLIAAKNRKIAEQALRDSIIQACSEYGLTADFVYQSVVIHTPKSDWVFDYHVSKVTLYHESSIKINFETRDYARFHCQFRDRKMKPVDVIEYIAKHDHCSMHNP